MRELKETLYANKKALMEEFQRRDKENTGIFDKKQKSKTIQKPEVEASCQVFIHLLYFLAPSLNFRLLFAVTEA